MQSWKDGKFLIFEREDGKVCKYNLETYEVVGFSGKKVKTLRSQLVNIDAQELVKSFERSNENYMRFLDFVRKKTGNPYNYGSASGLIAQIPMYSRYEQIFASGIKNIKPLAIGSLTEYALPKGLLKILREHEEIQLTDSLIVRYKEYPDMFKNIADNEYICGLDKIFNLMCGSRYGRSHFFELVALYGYDPVSLAKYIDQLLTYEAYGEYNICVDILDQANMASKLSNKYEKYPKNFATIHAITSRNYNKFKEKFDEEDFARNINNDLAWSYKDFVVIVPKATDDIKDEAGQQSNCVASYIEKVVKGYTQIVFLRKKDEPDVSYITVQVTNYRVVQARRRFNKTPTSHDKVILDKYQEYLDRLKKKKENTEVA